MRTSTRVVLVLAVLVPIGGCFPETEPLLAPPCLEAHVGLTAGAPTFFAWPGTCGVSGLKVTAANNSADIKWAFETPDKQPGIPSPVTYAQLPAGVTQTTAPTPLVTGAQYRAQFILHVNDVPSSIATITFTQP